MLKPIKYNTITVTHGKNTAFIPVPDIVYAVQKYRKYEVCVHNQYTNEVNIYTSYGKVNDYESLFFKNGLIKARKYLFINPKKVQALEDNLIIFDCGKSIHIGRINFTKLSATMAGLVK